MRERLNFWLYVLNIFAFGGCFAKDVTRILHSEEVGILHYIMALVDLLAALFFSWLLTARYDFENKNKPQ